MDLPFKSIALSTIVHATESEEKIKKAIGLLIPDEVEVEEEEVEGHYGDSKKILSVDIQRRPFMRFFWDQVLERLTENSLDWLEREALDRLADDCRLYLRFDKQFLVSEEKLKFSESGDVIHLRLNVSAYPAKREIAAEKIREFIESGFQYGD